MARKLTDEEKRLWKQEISNVKKTTLDEPTESEIFELPEDSEDAAPATIKSVSPKISSAPSIALPIQALETGNYAGVDAATVRRIKRGQMHIAARIDLHGMTQADAYPALVDFIQSAAAQNKRLVLVITGKGRRSDANEGGVLKNMLPKWLNTPELRPMVLALDIAQPLHGGSGAFYVLLKKSKL